MALIVLVLASSLIPFAGSLKFLTVLSGSMEPAIKTGSIVAVKPADSYKIGDIVTFGEINRTKTPVTHRIAEMKVENGQPVYITQGDANNGPDVRTITKKDIVGKVIFDIPYVGYAINAAKKPYGFLLLIIIPAVLVIFDEIKKIKKEIKKVKNDKAKNAKMEKGDKEI